MAVSHKTNNLINCYRCHLPFNFKNTAPKMLSCKHWYCFNCLEQLTHTARDKDTQFLDCLQCQKSLELMGWQKMGGEQILQQYEKKKLQILQNTNNYNYNNNKSDNNNMTTFGCEDDYAQKDFELENGNKTRSASLNSENSIGSFGYFNNNNSNHNNKAHDLDINLHLRTHNCNNAPNVGEKMLPGENCFIHGMPNTLWCQTCLTVLCRGCNAGTEHKDHKIENQLEAKEFYQNRVQQEFIQIQVSVEEMENLKHLQKGFLLKLLETCCTLKLQIEHELVINSSTGDIDEMKDTMKNLQLCFGLLGKQTPHEILKLYKVIKDENCKFKLKHKQMLQQCKMQQLLSKSQRILDFDLLKEILQKIDSSNSAPGDLNKLSENWFNETEANSRESNSIMILTNYCIYRLYMSYMRQQQQFIEQQFMRYQQYHQEQKQNLIKQFKMLQQHSAAALASQQQDSMACSNNNNTATTTNEFTTFFSQDKDKPKTYAEIATIQNAHQFDSNENSNGFDLITTTSNNFQPYKKPLTKSYEEPRKTVQLLFNPINNENNQIYFFDFERNGLPMGRVLIKVFADIAPKMSYNFHALATHEKGFGYSGCKVFECHPNESIITGDIEQNTGYSSRSIYEDVQFIPDDTNITPFPGAVGMRRAKKKFDSQGLVGSQFRIILTELGFTAIFACVIEGLEVVKKISQTLVQNDKIHGTGCVAGAAGSNGSLNNVNNINGSATVAGIFIAQCGLYEFVKRDIMCGI
ncbi:probable serine/threonine-protein kinase DDB_G0280133 [Lucilia sericata]|uniref:probable serine/threonine-protein kinase DDB_G0280133 n=1 Tax=Lucilia sericata TaxID=13632 RepID=UPI0018A87DC6|nr:probable serine/threonine-protein kinase DDB_G0280133 [Lucilia sericata]